MFVCAAYGQPSVINVKSDDVFVFGASTDLSQVNLHGGTVALSVDRTYTLDRLVLTGANTFDFRATDSAVVFSTSAGSGTLNITNYNYAADPTSGGPVFRFLDRSVTDLNPVTINGFPAIYYGNTDIVVAAVPEPATFSIGLGLIVLMYILYRKYGINSTPANVMPFSTPVTPIDPTINVSRSS